MGLDKFTNSFVWESDGRLDSWQILTPDVDGKYHGDCDDFAITVSYILSGGSLLRMWWNLITRKHWVYWCRDPVGGAHIILYVRGKGWIDNWYPYWRDEPEGHTSRYPIVVLWMVYKLLVDKVNNG